MTEHQVLLVEDDPLKRMALTWYFNQHDMPCLDCADGATALRACAQNYYSMILTDFHLPDMTGADLCRTIRQWTHLDKTVVFMMSESDHPVTIDAAFESGANAFLRKPESVKHVSQWMEATFGLR